MEFRVDGPASGFVNMQVDSDHLAAGSAVCRVYSWDGLWVSLGRFQSPERALISPSTTRHVIRPTGGKAVIHGADITVSISIPIERIASDSRSLRAVYRALAAPLVAAMRASGLPALLAEETPYAGRGAKTADCFAFNSPNDIVHEETGLKVCGCALRITDAAALMQASIPVRDYLAEPSEIVVAGQRLALSTWQTEEFPGALRESIVNL